MEDFLINSNIEWIKDIERQDFIELEKIDILNFYIFENKNINEITYNKVSNVAHEYIIDSDKLSDIALLPIDTKMCIRVDLGSGKWLYNSSIMALVIKRPPNITTILDASKLIGGGCVIMGRYIINKGDKIKFITKKRIDPLQLTFTNVLKLIK